MEVSQIQNEKVRCSEGYLGIIQRGKVLADMEYVTTAEPELSSRSLAQSYKAALAHRQIILGIYTVAHQITRANH